MSLKTNGTHWDPVAAAANGQPALPQGKKQKPQSSRRLGNDRKFSKRNPNVVEKKGTRWDPSVAPPPTANSLHRSFLRHARNRRNRSERGSRRPPRRPTEQPTLTPAPNSSIMATPSSNPHLALIRRPIDRSPSITTLPISGTTAPRPKTPRSNPPIRPTLPGRSSSRTVRSEPA